MEYDDTDDIKSAKSWCDDFAFKLRQSDDSKSDTLLNISKWLDELLCWRSKNKDHKYKEAIQNSINTLEEAFPELFLSRNSEGFIMTPRRLAACSCGFTAMQLPIRRHLLKCDHCGKVISINDIHKVGTESGE